MGIEQTALALGRRMRSSSVSISVLLALLVLVSRIPIREGLLRGRARGKIERDVAADGVGVWGQADSDKADIEVAETEGIVPGEAGVVGSLTEHAQILDKSRVDLSDILAPSGVGPDLGVDNPASAARRVVDRITTNVSDGLVPDLGPEWHRSGNCV